MSWPGYSGADLAAIAVGGVAGAGLRWLISGENQSDGGWFAYAPNASLTQSPIEFLFPARTLTVNLLGCLLLGALTLLLTRPSAPTRRMVVSLATGFCGSLTTFSTFAVEVAERFRGLSATLPAPQVNPLDYGPKPALGVAYMIVSVVGGGLAFWLGRTIAGQIVDTPGESTIGAVS